MITQNIYAKATVLSNMLNGQISHDKITRFLNNAEATCQDMWQYLKPEIHKIEETSGVLILEGSLEERPCTDENEIVAWQYSHGKNT